MIGSIIRYSVTADGPRKIGHVLECKTDSMLIRNDGNGITEWTKVANYQILMDVAPKISFVKSMDKFKNSDLVDLLSGTQRHLLICSTSFSYFCDLVRLLKPMVHIESLVLQGISEPIEMDFLEKFPSVIQLEVDNCSKMQWSGMKLFPLTILKLKNVQTSVSETLADILIKYTTPELHSLVIENCWNAWDKDLSFCFFRGLFQLTIRNCGVSHLLRGEKLLCAFPEFSSLWIENAPSLEYINPLFLLSCDTIHLQDVPLLNGGNFMSHTLRHVYLSKTGFSLQKFSSDAIVQLHLTGQKCDNAKTVLSNLKNLEVLTLRNFGALTKDMFPPLRRLKILHLDRTMLQLFHICDCVPSLESLILCGTETEYIEDLSKLKKFENLTLLSVPLFHLPENINRMRGLRQVVLVEVPLKTLPANWISCRRLEKIHIEPLRLEEEDMIYLPSSCEIDVSFHLRHEYIDEFHFRAKMVERAKIDIPSHLKCAICYFLLRSPFVTSMGHTYCRECILKWIKVRMTDPKTNMVLRTKMIFPNNTITSLLTEFLENYRMLYDPVMTTL